MEKISREERESTEMLKVSSTATVPTADGNVPGTRLVSRPADGKAASRPWPGRKRKKGNC